MAKTTKTVPVKKIKNEDKWLTASEVAQLAKLAPSQCPAVGRYATRLGLVSNDGTKPAGVEGKSFIKARISENGGRNGLQIVYSPVAVKALLAEIDLLYVD